MYTFKSVRIALALPALLLLTSCRASDVTWTEPAGPLVHLAERLAGARVESADAGEREERRWPFDAPRPEWRTLGSQRDPQLAAVRLEPLKDGVRLSLEPPPRPSSWFRMAGLVTDLGELSFDDWEAVQVEARSSDRLSGITVAYNLDDEDALPDVMLFFDSTDEAPPVFSDGSVQTYAIPLRARHAKNGSSKTELPKTLRSLAVLFAATETASVDILSVTLIPRGAAFPDQVGVRSIYRSGTTRNTLYAHAPAALTFPVDLPTGGRLDFALAVSPGETVTYRVRAEAPGSEPLFEETVDDPSDWFQRSVDLTSLAGQVGGLVLEAESDLPGAVALWGAPILLGDTTDTARRTGKAPNVIFYVIDSGDADLMSLYGYGRTTTPFLEALAQEGVLFTRGYSNSTWTQPSTVSFMTSLQHSVVGGLRRGMHSTAVPEAAVTMAEHFRRGGYQTVALTANPNAGRMAGLDRGVDFMRDIGTKNASTSSRELHEHFWRFRQAYPGGPTWVHFQTTDVHEPFQPEPPHAGRFVKPQESKQLKAWQNKLHRAMGGEFGNTSIEGYYDQALERTGIDRQAYFGTQERLYGETMLHQDDALRDLVKTLKDRGEWENTLLVIGSDHGHPAGSYARFGRGLLDPQPEPWQGALFDAYATRVPLLVIWPGHIEGGRRIDQPVSMLDVLPTLLDLVGLPAPEVLQGRSLAPLLRGQPMDPRPVILDEFRVDEASGGMIGNLEIIDGKWGASLEIAPLAEGADPRLGRHSTPAGGRWGANHPYFPEVPNLLLYDLEADPFATRAVNDEHPKLVERYRRLLLEQWKAHQALAGQFTASGDQALTPEQLQQLRALGYIQ